MSEAAEREVPIGLQLRLVLFGLVLPTAVGLCLLSRPLVTLLIAAPFREEIFRIYISDLTEKYEKAGAIRCAQKSNVFASCAPAWEAFGMRCARA